MLSGFAKVKINRNKSKGIEEIRCEGISTDLVWKSPITNFSTGSNVVVKEWEGAVFYLNGQASDELIPGQHILETCNISFGAQILSAILRERPSFTAELFFVNKTEMPLLRYGTGRITYMENGCTFNIGAHGTYHVRVENPRRLIEKFNVIRSQAGAEDDRQAFTTEHLQKYFMSVITNIFRQNLLDVLYGYQISILKANTKFMEVTERVKQELDGMFAEYGIRMSQFTMELKLPEENDRNDRESYRAFAALKALYQRGGTQDLKISMDDKDALAQVNREAQKTMIKAQAERARYDALGITYEKERQMNTTDKVVDSIGTSGIGDGIGNMVQAGVQLETFKTVVNTLSGVPGMSQNQMGMNPASQPGMYPNQMGMNPAPQPGMYPNQPGMNPVPQPGAYPNQQQTYAVITCPRCCRTDICADYNYCPWCGERLKAPTPQPEMGTVQPNS